MFCLERARKGWMGQAVLLPTWKVLNIKAGKCNCESGSGVGAGQEEVVCINIPLICLQIWSLLE